MSCLSPQQPAWRLGDVTHTPNTICRCLSRQRRAVVKTQNVVRMANRSPARKSDGRVCPKDDDRWMGVVSAAYPTTPAWIRDNHFPRPKKHGQRKPTISGSAGGYQSQRQALWPSRRRVVEVGGGVNENGIQVSRSCVTARGPEKSAVNATTVSPNPNRPDDPATGSRAEA